ncbi:hypothetical protein [Burkholderia ubonensis]|uniref:hypothetical protein n=1 Tax=Burkholderia ubonensis TaxID=101571 RepID=UPI001E28DB38|nr:hypothetical protein [Burkholderia ubonensis]
MAITQSGKMQINNRQAAEVASVQGFLAGDEWMKPIFDVQQSIYWDSEWNF